MAKALAAQADLGNSLIDFTWQVYAAAQACVEAGRQVYLFTEHPEDLGRVYREEDSMPLDPAAIWQLQVVHDLLQVRSLNLQTVAFHQCCFGAQYRKPTRVLSNLPQVSAWGPQGLPTFDEECRYQGPLWPCTCPVTKALAKQANIEGFRTTGTDQYPPRMDEALAQAIKHALHLHPAPPPEANKRSKAEVGEREKASSEAAGQAAGAADGAAKGGREGGEPESEAGPIRAYYKGKHRTIHDGGGLLSQGRWPVKVRKMLKDGEQKEVGAVIKKEFLKWIVKEPEGGKEAFRKMAAGEASASPFGAVMAEARGTLDACLRKLGQAPERREGDRVAEINFRRMYALAKVLEDEDCEFLPEMAGPGVPIGVGVELPRCEKMFEEKTKWAREFTEMELKEVWAENYPSAEEGKLDIYRQVDEDVKAGTIIRMSEEEAKAKYGDRLAVAALGTGRGAEGAGLGPSEADP